MASNNQDGLLDYLTSLTGDSRIESIAEAVDPPMRMSGTGAVGDTEAKRARDAVKKLSSGKAISSSEQLLIEAIILPNERPAVLVKDDGYDLNHKNWRHFNKPAIKSIVTGAIPSVGRIDVLDHPLVPYAGTGFIVGDGLMMTNRHVAEIFSRGLGVDGLRFRPGMDVEADMKHEHNGDDSVRVRVSEVVMIHPVWDMALLRVEGLPVSVRALSLSTTNPADLIGGDMAVIGYPAFDPRNSAQVQNKVFKGIYNVKRMQPGKLKAHETVAHYDHEIAALTHDASTLGGNSGSAVVDAETGEVVALHFGGIYKKTNYAVPAFDLSRDGRVVDAGVNFGTGGSVNVAVPNPNAGSWANADPMAEAFASGGATRTNAGGKITIPLTVTISMGTSGDQP